MLRLLLLSALAIGSLVATAQKKPATPAKSIRKTTNVKSSQPSGSSGWNIENRLAFLNSCIPGSKMSADSAQQYCYCMLEKVMKIYPSVMMAEKKFTPEKAIELAKTCWPNVRPSTWTDEDRTTFMDQCVKSAKSSVGEERAKEYCTCMQQKVELLYPTPADASKLTEAQINLLAVQCNQK
jgi:hypothetical protein